MPAQLESLPRGHNTPDTLYQTIKWFIVDKQLATEAEKSTTKNCKILENQIRCETQCITLGIYEAKHLHKNGYLLKE